MDCESLLLCVLLYVGLYVCVYTVYAVREDVDYSSATAV